MPLNFLSQLTGCFATPVAENPTVVMMEAAYRHHDLDWRYITTEVQPDGLADAVRGAAAMGWVGFNCSLPHKVAVIGHLDGLGESAALMGAVNTVVRRDGKWIGENTDGKGFVMALREKIDPRGASVVLFGAGGAARAVGVELALEGVSDIIVVNRDRDRGQAVVDLLNDKTPANAELVAWEAPFALPAGTNIAINATSVGLFPDVDAQLNFDLDTLSADMIVADAIPNPPRTNFIRDAEARGCVALDGLGMLVNQGVIAIKYWSGVDVDASVMRAALDAVFSANSD